MTSSSSSVPPGFPTGSRVMPEGQHAPRFDDFIPEDPLTNHEYDGIREYDNPTPGWWHAIFFATIIFSALYIMAYSWNKAANTPQEDLADRQVAEDTKLFGKLGELKGDEATIQQTRAEVAKVVWPSRREVMLTTIMVFIMAALTATFFSLVDMAIRFGLKLIVGAG